MESEIGVIIAREHDSRVAEGLRRYAVGRTVYSYKSSGNDDGQYGGGKQFK